MTNVQLFFVLQSIYVTMLGEDDAPINARTRGGSAADDARYVKEAHGSIVSAVRDAESLSHHLKFRIYHLLNDNRLMN